MVTGGGSHGSRNRQLTETIGSVMHLRDVRREQDIVMSSIKTSAHMIYRLDTAGAEQFSK